MTHRQCFKESILTNSVQDFLDCLNAKRHQWQKEHRHNILVNIGFA